MKMEIAQAFALISGRNVCGITTYDLSEKTGIPLERIRLIEKGNTKITLSELDSISKILFYRRHMFLGLTDLYRHVDIDDSNVLESIRKSISDLPADTMGEILEIFEAHRKDGFGETSVFLIDSRLAMLQLFYYGAILGRDSPDDDDNWRDSPPDTPIKPIPPTQEPLSKQDLVTA